MNPGGTSFLLKAVVVLCGCVIGLIVLSVLVGFLMAWL